MLVFSPARNVYRLCELDLSWSRPLTVFRGGRYGLLSEMACSVSVGFNFRPNVYEIELSLDHGLVLLEPLLYHGTYNSLQTRLTNCADSNEKE